MCNIIVYYYTRCVRRLLPVHTKTERRAWKKKTIEISTGGGRTRTDRRTPYALAEQQRWSVVAVVTDSSVVVSSAAAASAVGGSGGCTIRLCWLDGGRNCCVCARQTQTAAGKWRTVIGEHR